MVTLLPAATSGCMPQFVAIGANGGLPAIWNDVLEQPKVLRNHSGQKPVPLFGHPLSTTSHQQGSSVLVCWADLDGDQSSRAGRNRRTFYEQLDGGVSDRTVVTEAVTHTDKLICVSAGEALCAVLIGSVCLRNTERRELGIGCFHATRSTGGNCEA